MNKKVASLSAIALVLSLVALFAVGVGPAFAQDPGGAPSGDGVDPIFVAGNPSCTSLGYGFGFKINGAPNGIFTFTNPPGELTGGAPSDPNNSVTISNSNGTLFNWAATLGIDAVIVKGGPNADAFVYNPEDMADTLLHAPVNPNNGQYYGISHIEFCYDYELTASKTANASYTRTYSWTIDKSVDDDDHTGFTGDSFVSNYDVVVDQTVTDSDFAVSGTITVNNPTPLTVSFSVSDSVGGTNATVNCPQSSLAPGESTVCTYSASPGGKINGTNTATITSNTAGVGGTTASANYAFGDPTTTVGYPTINVTDTLGGNLGSASGDQTFEYPVTFTCDDDEGTTNNTATIVETGQSDSESVTVTCYELAVTKTANTSFDRDWSWTIEKSGDQSALTLSPGQSFLVNYEVIVNAIYTDSNWAVNGNISVHNPAPIAATLNSVSDVISGGINATVSCGVTFPYTLAAGGTLPCTYSASLPDGSSRINTATATLQNTPGGTTDFTGSANVAFGAPTTETDECVDVSDDQLGFLGTVCASVGDQSFSFNYSMTVGPYAECGEYTFVNIASFVTNDTGASDNNDHTVIITVPCLGCTLTPGYWKTHSEFGPARYDDTWTLLPNGASTTFFLSGKSYYQVSWTSPSGNAYYILAHAYIAAQLNQLNGADFTAAQAAFNQATTLLQTYTPAQIAAMKSSNPIRKQFISLASTLDQYNNGLIGPGHCSE